MSIATTKYSIFPTNIQKTRQSLLAGHAKKSVQHAGERRVFLWSGGEAGAGGEPVAPNSTDEAANGGDDAEVIFAVDGFFDGIGGAGQGSVDDLDLFGCDAGAREPAECQISAAHQGQHGAQ